MRDAQIGVVPTNDESISQAGEVRSARVESLRAIAALGVVGGHLVQGSIGLGILAATSNASASTLEKLGLSGGFAVYFFFALTGYLIYWPFAKRDFASGGSVALGRYARNRALRILPLYYFVIIVTLLTLEWGSPLGVWAHYLTFTQSFNADTVARVVGPAWSLVVDLHFYLLLPLLAWAIAKLSARSRIRAGALLLGLGAISIALRLHYVTDNGAGDPVWRFNLPATFFFFVPGMLIALMRSKLEGGAEIFARSRFLSSDVILLCGIPAWLVVGLGDYRLDPLIGLSAFLVVSACVLPFRPGPITRAVGWRPLAALGLASYSIYLWHEPLIGDFLKLDSHPSFWL